jgi:hypothetical protein
LKYILNCRQLASGWNRLQADQFENPVANRQWPVAKVSHLT